MLVKEKTKHRTFSLHYIYKENVMREQNSMLWVIVKVFCVAYTVGTSLVSDILLQCYNSKVCGYLFF